MIKPPHLRRAEMITYTPSEKAHDVETRATRSQRAHGVVVTYPLCAKASRCAHMTSTRNELARRLAALTGFAYDGDYDPIRHHHAPTYFVPSETLTSEAAARAGIWHECDLFGGVVPHPFVATKTITHSLIDPESPAPAGWCAEFPCRVADVVLQGSSAFDREDALDAGRRLLRHGAVRVKPGGGIAGLGQAVVGSAAELAAALEAITPDDMTRSGVVVEQNLDDVTTYSVGQVRVAELIGTYHGTQFMTRNNRGAEVYGGSELTVVRGDFDALLALELTEEVRVAVAQARAYDGAASRCFDGFFASRRNYDVARGRDGAGNVCSGVLEQSWRMGGASGAEIGALEAFRADPSLQVVRATAREVYGEAPELPPSAAIYFSGIDGSSGPLTKFALIEPRAHAR